VVTSPDGVVYGTVTVDGIRHWAWPTILRPPWGPPLALVCEYPRLVFDDRRFQWCPDVHEVNCMGCLGRGPPP